MERKFAYKSAKYEDRIRYRRDDSLRPESNDFAFSDGSVIVLPRESGEPARLAAKEFAEFLLDGMGVSVRVRYAEPTDETVCVRIDPAYRSYKCYRIETRKDRICITAHDDRGAQQAFYYMESRIRARRAPFLSCGITERAPLFSPRMIHGAVEGYPDIHLREIAYAGMDAIITFCDGVDSSGGKPADCNTLIARAARYGLDVYLFSTIPSAFRGDDPNADDYYESTYGSLFERCPGFKGVILLSEVIPIPTKDPNATPCPYNRNITNGVPNDRPSCVVWPCIDYGAWVNTVKTVVRRHKPDADIIFWTYNYGSAPFEHRKRLIEALPTDISLLATFETYEKREFDGVTIRCADYTLAFEGPSTVFRSEAELAKKRGMQLYTMSNTGGRTWDFGVVPYEPMPFQWMRRYAALRQAKKDWGLSGLMESHCYGFWPSFISELAREAFETPTDDDAALDFVLSAHFEKAEITTVKDALADWSKAITKYTATNEEQYGAFRTGPTYPFNLLEPTEIPGFVVGAYSVFYPPDNMGGKSTVGIRLPVEIRLLSGMLEDMERGLSKLCTVEAPGEELKNLINMGKFMVCCIRTGIGAKKWFAVHVKLLEESDPDQAEILCEEAERILLAEKKNVEEALPLVKEDSRLGYSPEYGYGCSPEQLEWKLRHLDYVLNSELRTYRAGICPGDDYERLFIPYRYGR